MVKWLLIFTIISATVFSFPYLASNSNHIVFAQKAVAPVISNPPIPSPSSCTYAGTVMPQISQASVAIGANTITKHAEKDVYSCIVSGFPTQHFILDTTTYTTITDTETATGSTSNTFTTNEVVCGKNPLNATLYLCETMPVGRTLVPATSCTQLNLGSPQAMDTLIVNGVAKTIESQKELFKCSTLTGTVIQDVIIWTIAADDSGGHTSSSYVVETCQKPATTTTSLPSLNCQTAGQIIFPPDLVVTSFAAPSSAKTGNTYTATIVETNQGLVSAGPHTVGLYLSNTPYVTSDSVVLIQVPVSKLAGDQSITLTVPFTMPALLPAGFSPGPAYFVAFADDQNNVVEFNENNNQLGSATTIS